MTTVTLIPVSDDSPIEFGSAPPTLPHYEKIADNVDGTWIGNTDPNNYHQEWYGLSDLPSVSSITSAKVYTRCRRYGTSTLPIGIVTYLRISGTPYQVNSTDAPYSDWQTIESASLTTNPATGQPWTKDDIDNMQVQLYIGHQWYATYGVITKTYIEVVCNLGMGKTQAHIIG